MANCLFPGKHLNVLFVSIYFCLVYCRVSCFLVNVKRAKQDIVSYVSYPGLTDCTRFCSKRNAVVHSNGFKRSESGTCSCQCIYDYNAFVVADLNCTSARKLRDTKKSTLDFVLYKYEQPNGPLKIIPFNSSNITILFYVKKMGDGKKCDLVDIEELSQKNSQDWISVKHLLKHEDEDFFELDDDHIETKYKWIDLEYEGWMMLTLHLNWDVNPDRFVGCIMKLNVTCKKRKTKERNGSMVFKVNGTFTVPGSTITSSTLALPSISHFPTPTFSFKSTISLYNTTTMKVKTPVLTKTTSILSTSHQGVMMSSSSQPMTSLYQTMTSLYQTMTSSTPQAITSTTSSILISSSQTGTTRFSHSLTLSMMQISSSFVFSSSSIMKMGPATASKSSSTAAVTGGVIAGILVLLFIFVLVVYKIRKKRRWMFIREKKSELGNLNPNYRSSFPSLHVIPALNNPLNDGVYENPEAVDDDVNRQSGIPSFESAAYDAAIVVENPSAKREVNSVYDNIVDENTYKALDPAKREPSNKYQSLINPQENEYSTVSDKVPSAPIQEPLYSEIDRQPVPVRNGHGLKAPTPPPFTHRKSHHPVVVEPIYNELEKSGEGKRTNEITGPAPPPLTPRKTHTPVVTEPVYNVLEDTEDTVKPKEVSPSIPPRKPLTQHHPRPPAKANRELKKSHNQPQENEERIKNKDVDGFEMSNEVDGKKEPVYSVLEDN